MKIEAERPIPQIKITLTYDEAIMLKEVLWTMVGVACGVKWAPNKLSLIGNLHDAIKQMT